MDKRQQMIPLIFARQNEDLLIKMIAGGDRTKRFLASLGFVPGTHLTIITETNGNVIVGIKDSRIAIGKELALKIMI